MESVCEVAQLLKVKFLKDCFVKINQKEYAEIKAGKRSLQDVNSGAESPFKTPSPVRSPRSRSKSPTKQVCMGIGSEWPIKSDVVTISNCHKSFIVTVLTTTIDPKVQKNVQIF